MQSLPPSGFPISDGPQWTPKAAPTAQAQSPAAADKMEFARPASQNLLIKPGPLKAPEPPRLTESPRPWPPSGTATSAHAALNAEASGHVNSKILPGQVAVTLPQVESGNAKPGPDGWSIPKNPNKTPLRPRDIFNVPIGTEDLGPLKIASSCSGRIRNLRLQWPEEFQEPAFGAQKAMLLDVLTRLEPQVNVHVVADGLAAKALPRMLKEWDIPAPERINVHALHVASTPELLYEPMTMWARDGALLLKTVEGQSVLLLPKSFRGDTQVDPKLNRLIVQGTGVAPARLQEALPDLIVRRSDLYFEGGDVVASNTAALVGAHTVARNMTEYKQTCEQILQRFSQLLGVPTQVVDPQPDFHIDLGVTFLDDQTLAVADPAAGMRLAPQLKTPVEQTLEKGLVDKYERALSKLANSYKVVRIPTLAGLGLMTPYYTYNNVLIESYEKVKRVYMPVYDVPALDESARQIYREQGFQVIDMPSARLSTKLWGALRCATGEL